MKPGDLVKYKNGNVYLINGKREIKGKVVYYFLDGFPDNQVFSPEDLELISEASVKVNWIGYEIEEYYSVHHLKLVTDE